jgi:hypothetical protein
VDIPQGSVPGLLLYLLYTADLPTSPESTTITFSQWSSHCFTQIKSNLLAMQNWFKKWRMKANRSHSLHKEKRPIPPCPRKQCATPPRISCQVSWATPWRETYLAQTHFHKTATTKNHPHQNVLVTQMQVKTLQATNFSYIKHYSNQSGLYEIQLWSTASTSNRNSRTFPIKSFAPDSEHILVRADYGYPKGSPNTNS